ncbi:hypothetical protein Tco_0677920 [Tanacetum coccineum]|uniref:Uncharacterized protein n=1 Tax=Tanacetum coccineum TaxID=301880 RepID=A0ABQ4XDL4_9ASTR
MYGMREEEKEGNKGLSSDQIGARLRIAWNDDDDDDDDDDVLDVFVLDSRYNARKVDVELEIKVEPPKCSNGCKRHDQVLMVSERSYEVLGRIAWNDDDDDVLDVLGLDSRYNARLMVSDRSYEVLDECS